MGLNSGVRNQYTSTNENGKPCSQRIDILTMDVLETIDNILPALLNCYKQNQSLIVTYNTYNTSTTMPLLPIRLTKGESETMQ